MDDLRIGRSVQRITIIETTADGKSGPVVLYKRKAKKKQTRGLSDIGKVIRRALDAERTYADDYVRRHDSSNDDRRDGWLKDLGSNMFRARRKGLKKLRLRRLVLG